MTYPHSTEERMNLLLEDVRELEVKLVQANKRISELESERTGLRNLVAELQALVDGND